MKAARSLPAEGLPSPGPKRRKIEGGSSDQLHHFRCNPCDLAFTSNRSLLRHLRESKQHQNSRGDTTQSMKCSHESCDRTFARDSNRIRHEREQHGDGKKRCEGCGKRVRPNSEHNAPGAKPCSTGTKHNRVGCEARPITPPADEQHSPRYEETCDGRCFLNMPLTPDASPGDQIPSSNRKPDSSTKSSRNYRASVPCGLCRQPFEFDDSESLFEHLNNHFMHLESSYWCSVCEIGFTHEADLTRHLQLAEMGDCGFAFTHTAPCGGHHPPSTSLIIDGSDKDHSYDNDRFNFCYRLRSWEQSQLRTYRASTALVARPLHPLDNIHTCPMQRPFPETPTAKRYIISLGGLMTAQPARVPYRLTQSRRPMARQSEPFEKPGSNAVAPLLEPTTQKVARSPAAQQELAEDQEITLFRPSTPPRPIEPVMPDTPDKRAKRPSIGTIPAPSTPKPRNHEINAIASSSPAPKGKHDWQSYLCRASLAGDLGIVQSLMQMGIRTDFHDYFGYSSIHYAAAGGHEDIVRLLAECGANLDLLSVNGLTPLHVAGGYGRLEPIPVGRAINVEQSTNVMRTLIELGADVNATDFNDRTPLHTAVAHEFSDTTVQILLEGGANPNAHTWQMESVLHVALESMREVVADLIPEGLLTDNKRDVIKLLVDAGADVNIADIDFAREVGADGQTISYLIDAGGTISPRSAIRSGCPPLKRIAHKHWKKDDARFELQNLRFLGDALL